MEEYTFTDLNKDMVDMPKEYSFTGIGEDVSKENPKKEYSFTDIPSLEEQKALTHPEPKDFGKEKPLTGKEKLLQKYPDLEKWESEAIEPNPWVDPTQVVGGTLVAGAKTAGTLLAKAGVTLASTITGLIAEPIVGTIGEKVAEDYPILSLPLGVALGYASGRWLEAPVIKNMINTGKTAGEAIDYLTKSKSPYVKLLKNELGGIDTSNIHKYLTPDKSAVNDPTKLLALNKGMTEALGKGNQHQVLEDMGMTSEKMKTEAIIKDAVADINAAEAFIKRGDTEGTKNALGTVKENIQTLLSFNDEYVNTLLKPYAAKYNELNFMSTPNIFKKLVESIGNQTGAVIVPQAVTSAVDKVRKPVATLIDNLKGNPNRALSTQQGIDSMWQHHQNIRDVDFSMVQLERGFDDFKKINPNIREELISHALDNPTAANLARLSPEEGRIKDYLKQVSEEVTNLGLKSGVLTPETAKANYLYHSWIDPKTGVAYNSRYGDLNTSAPQLKRRSIETIQEGIDAGQTPATLNPAKLIRLGSTSLIRAIESRELMKSLNSIETDLGVMFRGGNTLRPETSLKLMRLVERWSDIEEQGLKEHYIKFNTSDFLSKSAFSKDSNGNSFIRKIDVGVTKELYPFVNAYMNDPTYGKLANIVFVSKSMKLNGSFFHVISLNWQAFAGAPGKAAIPVYNVLKGLKQIKLGDDALQVLHRNGLELKGYADIGNAFKDTTSKLAKIPLVGKLTQKTLGFVQDFTFNVVHAGIKTNTSIAVFDQMKVKQESILGRALTDIEKNDIAKRTVNYVNRLYSGEDYKSALLQTNDWMAKYFYAPGARKAWQMLLISPQWQKAHIGMVGDIATAFTTKRGNPDAYLYRRYMYKAIAIYAAANLYNYAATKHMDGEGRWMYQNYGDNPFSIRALYDNDDKSAVFIKPLKSIFEVPELLPSKEEGLEATTEKIISKLAPWIPALAHQIPYQVMYDTKDKYSIDETGSVILEEGSRKKYRINSYKGKGILKGSLLRAEDISRDLFAPINFESVTNEKKHPISKGLAVFGVPTTAVNIEEEKAKERESEAAEEITFTGID